MFGGFFVSYKSYIANRRAKFDSISGYVNIPYGTQLEADDKYIYFSGMPICAVTSKNAHEYFSQNCELRCSINFNHDDLVHASCCCSLLNPQCVSNQLHTTEHDFNLSCSVFKYVYHGPNL